MNYRVTLVQRIKKEIEAETPEAALEAALRETKTEAHVCSCQTAHLYFEPNSWAVKEIAE